MKNLVFSLSISAYFCVACSANAQTTLRNMDLRHIDNLAVSLEEYTEELHREYHEHLEGIRYAKTLDDDVTKLEELAHRLHEFVHSAPAENAETTNRIRKNTNDFLQLSYRIPRTIDLTEIWLSSHDARIGISHMRSAARDVRSIVNKIDNYLPVDETVVDDQAVILERAVKELDSEFREHLRGYEHSQHIGDDLRDLTLLVEHIHELAHDRSFSNMNFRHLRSDLEDVKRSTLHIDELLVAQARRGVRQHDWVGIEHSRDAVTDVLASNKLLIHMIDKATFREGHSRLHPEDRDDHDRDTPIRDRHRQRNLDHDL